ncbi:hypothetical protein BCV69DRAFT_315197 [Microstroma glucosiphilum]|uniref:Uncharacterized protein n=1 Tax=Pseudomicrostroma glucosiphilum TaxID=1684307 RepID=A0A316TWI5_9BASI|nr:hypothetical protein BCV69DRAFT_315197 [Pseudomicrostroma glucosiphilum]PWN17799.1 hypothetical protein BCV69DRAFT_315197 [Pseudomicrostroma glucosiphilum]
MLEEGDTQSIQLASSNTSLDTYSIRSREDIHQYRPTLPMPHYKRNDEYEMSNAWLYNQIEFKLQVCRIEPAGARNTPLKSIAAVYAKTSRCSYSMQPDQIYLTGAGCAPIDLESAWKNENVGVLYSRVHSTLAVSTASIVPPTYVNPLALKLAYETIWQHCKRQL